MTVKEMTCIINAIINAKEAIAQLACENYPHTAFEEDFGKMYYQLNDMCLAIWNKIDAAEEAAATKGE